MRFMLFFVAFAVALPTAPAGAITCDDGVVHVIDAANSFPFDATTRGSSCLFDSHGGMCAPGGGPGSRVGVVWMP